MDDSVGGNGGNDDGSHGDKSNNPCTPKKPYDGTCELCKEYGHSLYDCYQLDTPTTDDLPATMIHAAAISTAFNIAMEQLAEKAGDTAEWPATKAELLAEQAAFNAAEAKMWSVAVERAATAAEAFANASDYLEKKNE